MNLHFTLYLLCVALSGGGQSSGQEPAPHKFLNTEELVSKISDRITYVHATSTVRVQNATTLELGFNPSLTETEVTEILALKQVDSLECYFCPICCRKLKLIMVKHKLRRLVLGYGRDETCALLSQIKSLESIDFRDGDVTYSGFVFLSRLPKLQKLHIGTQRMGW